MKIFISHSSQDKELLEEFVDLLITGVGIPRNEIFCSSKVGAIPEGSDFKEYIKTQMEGATFVIAVISPTFNESAFCLAEMGAVWISGKDFFPILVELPFSDLKAVLGGLQGGRLEDDSLDNLKDRLCKAGGYAPTTGDWNTQKRKFLKRIATLKIAQAQTISSKKLQEVNEQLTSTEKLLDETESAKRELADYVKKLESLKDKMAVAQVKKSLKVVDPFEELIDEFTDEASDVPNIVLEALFQEKVHGDWEFEQYQMPEINRAVEDGYLYKTENSVCTDRTHGAVERLKDLIRRMDIFLENDEDARAKSDFVRDFDEDYPLQLDKRGFWKTYLGLR